VQAMILAETTEEREEQLAKLLPLQRGDFEGILRVMKGLPVVIRLIDPPLHEFLPNREDLVRQTTELRITKKKPKKLKKLEKLLARVEQLSEANPMLGLRGVRLSILYPEITRMQVRAIMEAACDLKKKGIDARPEIMIPLVGHVNELKGEVAKVEAERGKLDYKFGTMIEIPRAALTAGAIAEYAEFFSFGTNDLTQTTFGISRDDAASFLGTYTAKGILPIDPFISLDRDGVGEMIRIATDRGRKVRNDLKLGICGEHGGDPASVAFCHEVGLDYVSCSPFRVPIARLAAAQAALGKDIASTA